MGERRLDYIAFGGANDSISELSQIVQAFITEKGGKILSVDNNFSEASPSITTHVSVPGSYSMPFEDEQRMVTKTGAKLMVARPA